MSLIVTVLGFGLGLVFLIAWLYYRTENKTNATFVKQNTTEFVVAGEGLLKILSNDDTKILTKDGKLVNPGSLGPGQEEVKINWFSKWLRKEWGFYWVSLFYPIRKIHYISIVKERLKGSAEIPPGAPLRDMIERDSKPTSVPFLLNQFPRPFVFEDIETKENFSIDVLVSGIFSVYDPALIAFKYNERFFDFLKAAISGALLDAVKTMDYKTFREADKGKGSPLSQDLKSRLQSLKVDLGVEVIDIWVDIYQLTSGDEAEEAAQALEIAELKGEADLAAARFDKRAAQERAKGAAAPVLELTKAYKKANSTGVGRLVSTDRSMEHLGQNSRITTLVMGSGVTPNLSLPALPPAAPTAPVPAGSGGGGSAANP